MSSALMEQSSPALYGNFNGENCIKDSETGYLSYPNDSLLARLFGATKKKAFLKLLAQTWPNIPAACKGIGISYATYINHSRIDPKFKADLEELQKQHTFNVQGVMYKNALTPRGFMDRIALLRAYEPETFNPDKKVQVTGTLTHEVVVQKSKNLTDCIDAELID
jgi:hypothetical protein